MSYNPQLNNPYGQPVYINQTGAQPNPLNQPAYGQPFPQPPPFYGQPYSQPPPSNGQPYYPQPPPTYGPVASNSSTSGHVVIVRNPLYRSNRQALHLPHKKLKENFVVLYADAVLQQSL